MSLATSNRDGGRTSESGHLRALLKGLKAQVLTGLAVSQRGAGANMSVDVAIGDAMIPRSDGTYGHPAWNDAVYNVAITTADVSNPRRDIVVMYIDYSVTPSTGVSNNTNGVVKIAVIAGTPAGSPSDPSNAAIQSAVGASNPYIKLARVRVAAGASSITNSVIDDLRLMASGIQQGGWIFDDLYIWVYDSATAFTIAGVDATAQFPIGTKIALYQSGTIKYFYVTNATFSTNTTITVDGGGTYSLTNVPIDKPALSYAAYPVGFPTVSIPNQLDGWKVLANVTASGTVTSISSGTIPARKFLKILCVATPTGGTLNIGVRFNNDSGANYAERGEVSGSVDFAAGSLNQFNTKTAIDANRQFTQIIGENNATQEKLFIAESIIRGSAGAANAPERKQGVYKWVNTSNQITRVDMIDTGGTGDIAAGSTLLVLGKD